MSQRFNTCFKISENMVRMLKTWAMQMICIKMANSSNYVTNWKKNDIYSLYNNGNPLECLLFASLRLQCTDCAKLSEISAFWWWSLCTSNFSNIAPWYGILRMLECLNMTLKLWWDDDWTMHNLHQMFENLMNIRWFIWWINCALQGTQHSIVLNMGYEAVGVRVFIHQQNL